MSLNEYLSQKEEMVVQKKQEVLSLKTHNALLARSELKYPIGRIAKLLEAHKWWQSYHNGVVCDFREQADENSSCLPTSLGLSEE